MTIQYFALSPISFPLSKLTMARMTQVAVTQSQGNRCEEM